MKFLLDAHLPRRLCTLLADRGHDATHTLNLSAGNHTKDSVINQISVMEQRIVISKDSDFVYSHVLQGETTPSTRRSRRSSGHPELLKASGDIPACEKMYRELLIIPDSTIDPFHSRHRV